MDKLEIGITSELSYDWGEMIQLVDQGGPFVWVLAVLAFASMFFVMERIFFFQKVRINVGDLLLGLANHVRKGAYAEALHEAVLSAKGNAIHLNNRKKK